MHHRDALAQRDLQPQLQSVLQKAVNYEKFRLFKVSPGCIAVQGNLGQPQYTYTLLLYWEVRYLLIRKVSKRLEAFIIDLK